MANLNALLDQFERECQTFADEWLDLFTIVESERRYNFIKIRIRATAITFIDLYYNAQNGRGSYALIRNHRRVFGYDGMTQWHRHPLDNPETHQRCAKPRLAQVLREMRQIVETLTIGE